jgi:hypothetical protein
VVQNRNTTFSEDLVGKDCQISPTGHLFDHFDEFVLTATAGLIRPEIIQTFDIQNWAMPLALSYYIRFNGTWAPVTGQIRHEGGEMKLRVGPIDPVSIATDDGYAAYDLAIGRK